MRHVHACKPDRRAGRRVVVREWHRNVGERFHSDFQGLENWSDERDVLDELAAAGIEVTFEHHPVSRGIVYDSRGNRYRVQSGQPLFYLVRRGAEAGCLDHALLRHAIAAGVDVRFEDRVSQARGPTVLAIGPRRADVIAAGFGMRYAFRSGLLAARSILDGTDYTRLWRYQLLPLLCARTVNRFIFNLSGELGRRAAARMLSRGDARMVLRRFYQPSLVSRLLFPIARLRYRAPLRDRSCDHVDCQCVWCQCQAERNATTLA